MQLKREAYLLSVIGLTTKHTVCRLQHPCYVKSLEYIANKYPFAKDTGVGIGAGCALVFSYLGEYGSSSLLKAAACVSLSYDNTETLSNRIPKFSNFYCFLTSKR